ncbi:MULTISPECIES: hypothetical protein [Pseudomonadaceae]|uniref:Uncharacterized protein n=1 Tax=Aquipseudomonas alcaligenes (strain ATCC 14909 / DSM 50342 / CCUG 1425 / JCM 20561 / NBRC 14159 / NCIMB 9945 / NCTC 10367 / 1577) TaxID=1215092 RepID=U3B3S4_AQUA1|nr:MULTISPECIES: hypothetical protein [Pseudomonas]NMY41502.1 hypothetical protein [Pseudomonas sp. WS 5013]GAD61558.1 hypothetical protein PA6_006_02070 [Pseudomonas alcaligenes NBRC 14159]
MQTSNIERFDQATGLIFAQLYSEFPRRTTLTSGVLEPMIRSIVADSDWLTELSAKESFFSNTMDWLLQAGFIWHHEKQSTFPTQYLGCVLTTKALEALKATPASLSGESLGQSLKEAATSGLLDSLKGLTNEVLSKGVHMAVGAAQSWT